jgi:hypothetical protein
LIAASRHQWWAVAAFLITPKPFENAAPRLY